MVNYIEQMHRKKNEKKKRPKNDTANDCAVMHNEAYSWYSPKKEPALSIEQAMKFASTLTSYFRSIPLLFTTTIMIKISYHPSQEITERKREKKR